jgi:hypothetical protein
MTEWLTKPDSSAQAKLAETFANRRKLLGHCAFSVGICFERRVKKTV